MGVVTLPACLARREFIKRKTAGPVVPLNPQLGSIIASCLEPYLPPHEAQLIAVVDRQLSRQKTMGNHATYTKPMTLKTLLDKRPVTPTLSPEQARMAIDGLEKRGWLYVLYREGDVRLRLDYQAIRRYLGSRIVI